MPRAARKPEQLEILNEVLAPKPGETPIYRLVLSDDDVEKLAHGRVSRDLIEQAWAMLSWKREANQSWEDFERPCRHCADRIREQFEKAYTK